MARPRDYPYGADIRSSHLTFSAGDPCLNFANTRELRKGDEPQEFLRSYKDLVLFGRRIGLITDTEAGCLRDLIGEDPSKGASSLKKALRLREATYRVVSGIAGDSRAPEADLETIDRFWRRSLPRSRLRWADGRFSRSWDAASELDSLAWRLADSAVDLLTSERLSLARECAGADCGWLFLDTSRNKRRRWCSMKTCGNRAKSAKHYTNLVASRPVEDARDSLDGGPS